MYRYKAKLLRVVDGDTADVMIDLGFNVWTKQRLRFKSVDTWEKRTKNKEEKVKGLAASAFTKEYLEKNDGLFTIQSHGVGKYGRVLAEIFIKGEDKSLNELLIEIGFFKFISSFSLNIDYLFSKAFLTPTILSPILVLSSVIAFSTLSSFLNITKANPLDLPVS